MFFVRFFDPNEIFIVCFGRGFDRSQKTSPFRTCLPWRSSSLPSSMAYNRGARGFSSEDFTVKRVVSGGFRYRVSFGGLGWVWNWPTISADCFLSQLSYDAWWMICLNGIEERYLPSIFQDNQYHGYTYVRGTPVLVPWLKHLPQQILGCDQPKPDILRRFRLEMHCGLEKRYRNWKGALWKRNNISTNHQILTCMFCFGAIYFLMTYWPGV